MVVVLVQTHNSRWRARCANGTSYTQVGQDSNFRFYFNLHVLCKCLCIAFVCTLRCGKSATKVMVVVVEVAILQILHIRDGSSPDSYSTYNVILAEN